MQSTDSASRRVRPASGDERAGPLPVSHGSAPRSREGSFDRERQIDKYASRRGAQDCLVREAPELTAALAEGCRENEALAAHFPRAGSVSDPAMRRRWISSTQLRAPVGLEVIGERGTVTRYSLVTGAMSMGERALPLRSVVVSERMRACLSG